MLRGVLCVLWVVGLGAGFAAMFRYQSTVGEFGRTPERWPMSAPISLDSGRPTLLVFAHPQCPCTRASLEELNRVLARAQSNVVVHVWFFEPSPRPREW